MSKWINDNKSAKNREDLAYKSICYINVGVIERNELRKNLDVKNHQSVVIERSRGVMVINTAQFHSTKPELRLCAGSKPARGVSDISDSEDL